MGTEEDDRITVVAGKLIKAALNEFMDTICEMKHEEVDEVKKDLKNLIKLNASLFIAVIGTLIAVILK